jgi:hypothetical protein
MEDVGQGASSEGPARRSFLLSWVLLIFWAIVIFCLSAVPGDQLDLPLFPHADKLAHAGLYGVLAFLMLRAFDGTSWKFGSRIVCTLVVGLGYGISDEIHQYFVAGRQSDVWDVLADFAGGLVGCGIWYFLILRKRRVLHDASVRG